MHDSSCETKGLEKKPLSYKGKTPELLAPAGGMSQLKAAIRFGADAVYLAADKYGMRQRAENFTLDTIGEAVAYAHERGVSVYATLNVVMHDTDLDELPAYLQALEAAQVDAVIVSDLGALSLAKHHAPSVAIHVSTQASVSNAEAACMWHSLGATRVVCAREMSLADIARMRESIPPELEIEAFVHGAMCMAVSGRCLISAALTGRSANKGNCTQPCRWNYALVEEKRPDKQFPIEEDERGTYLMNAEDLNMLRHLDELTQAGISSFKIEGRNKKAFYVASVVHAYRAVMDGASPSEVESELFAMSHRPYSTGFYYGEPQQSLELDGYVKECLHVATVQSCRHVSDDAWHVEVMCFNRFFDKAELECLSPYTPVFALVPSNLQWLKDKAQTGTCTKPELVEVANRASEIYSFMSSVPVRVGDYLSVRIEPKLSTKME